MNKKLFAKICFNFNKEPNEELYNLWFEELKEYDDFYVKIAIDNIIKNDKYMPTLARVVDELKKINIEIPTDEKKKRMLEKNIIPAWFDKEDYKESTQEEIKELENLLKEYRDE